MTRVGSQRHRKTKKRGRESLTTLIFPYTVLTDWSVQVRRGVL